MHKILSLLFVIAFSACFSQSTIAQIPYTIAQAKSIINAAEYEMDTVEGIWSVGGTVYVLVDGKVVNEIHQPDVRKMCTLKSGEGVFTSYELFDEQYAYLYDTAGDTVFKVEKNDGARMTFTTTSREQWYDYRRFFAYENVWGDCEINVTQIDTFTYSYVPPKEVTAYSFAGYDNPDATLRFDVKWTRIWPAKVKEPEVVDTVPVEPEKPQPEIAYGSHGVPSKMNKRKVELQEEVTVESEWVELRIWDKSRADGDTISIYYNGMWVLKDYGLTNEKQAIKIRVRPEKGNCLIFQAENLGTVPPNTAAMVIWDGTKEVELVVSSDLQMCGAVKLSLPGGGKP